MLLNKRLDLDIAHTRLRKAHEADHEARVSYSILSFPRSYSFLYSFLSFNRLALFSLFLESECEPAGRRLPVSCLLHVQLPPCEMAEGQWCWRHLNVDRHIKVCCLIICPSLPLSVSSNQMWAQEISQVSSCLSLHAFRICYNRWRLFLHCQLQLQFISA